MIFGHLLTSSNYNDEEEKVTGGRNGYGAKLCNIFSTKFTVETSSSQYKNAFKQTWMDNMSKAGSVKIKPASGDDFTKITFCPDLSKFKMEKLDKDTIDLLSRRAYDVAASTRGIKVFLNGTRLPGGRHVDYVTDALIKNLIEQIKKKNKGGMTIKPFQVKSHMWIFINCLIVNPTFDSQTKENMTLQAKNFGSKCTLSDKFLTQVAKSGLVEQVLTWAKFKAQTILEKAGGGKKKSKLRGIPKLDDANDAGTKNSLSCTLILTEGDSAKALAVSGLGVIGRDKYGVFPLRGKLLNVREASHKQILENAEINNIIKIVGLKYKMKYETREDLETLRYGKIMIMTDQDQVWVRRPRKRRKSTSATWRGIGSSSSTPEPNATSTSSWPSARNASNKGRNGSPIGWWSGRGGKSWACRKNTSTLKIRNRFRSRISLTKNWCCFRTLITNDRFLRQSMASSPANARNDSREVRVAQLAGSVAEHSAYHHGEVSLMATIINLAQNYVGTNNINLLQPLGQFGTRLQGGKDAASPRYIFTMLSPLARLIFHPHDDPLLKYQKEDNQRIEPVWYIPVIPMLLVNGADGIGTGWMTKIPNYNPREIIDCLLEMIDGKEPSSNLKPWYKNFRGDVESLIGGKYVLSGEIAVLGEDKVEITELPIGVWTHVYKENVLEPMLAGNEKTKAPPLIT
ncbi:unnamed protein product [Nesidiocoris tenuis]|uniref:DNA topoisomerase 2 n=1 Tax=Nesidiocoris tenuis TaxID=355587 RepID=A0A6H5FSZ8_9HEMI|nr:unnamed protein product [Nesidiocoris tenuis]